MPLPDTSLLRAYKQLLDNQSITKDEKQSSIILKLNKLQLYIENSDRYKQSSFFTKIFQRKPSYDYQGIYLYGGVGRGKTMIMDLFFNTTSIRKKRRVHFHNFMQEIHATIHSFRQSQKSDPIPPIAKELAHSTSLLCFDEFHVLDITDAMLLGRLFTAFFNHGIHIVITSNRPPEDLYKDGLQRDLFLPFIGLLKHKLEILELDSPTDYRLKLFHGLKRSYFTPLGKEANHFIYQCFHQLTQGATPQMMTLQVGARALHFPETHNDILITSFQELCATPLSAKDYLEIARNYSTILLKAIPVLTNNEMNEAKRFVTLIDILYEHGVKFICTAAVEPHRLYQGTKGSFEFERCASRLMEMQSDRYLQLAHNPH